MKRSFAEADRDADVCASADKRICNRTVTHAYAYAITSSDPIGWHAYSGYVPDVSECVNAIATELTSEVEKCGMKLQKVRWQIRVTGSGEGMVTFSSIVVFVEDVCESPSQPVSMVIKSCLFDNLSKRAPLYTCKGQQYVLREMTISDGVAFVVCPPNVNIGYNSKYHNEWFSQPIGDLVSWDGTEKNTLRIFQCVDGKVDIFRGNDTHDRDACFVMYMGDDNKLFRYVGPR